MTRRTQGIRGGRSVDPFVRDTVMTLHRLHVVPDTELTVGGISGRCRFVALVTNPANDRRWVDVIDSKGCPRSVNVDQVTTVHTTVKTRDNLT